MPDKGGTARRRTTRGILTFTTKVMSKVAPGCVVGLVIKTKVRFFL